MMVELDRDGGGGGERLRWRDDDVGGEMVARIFNININMILN